jgi:FO synthase
MNRLERLLAGPASGSRVDDSDAWEIGRLSRSAPGPLLAAARDLRDATTGPRITFSKKVFIPLTKLCRDACGYCTFAHPPVPGERAFLTIEEVLEIARAGEAQGCREALFTLGDKPERK